LKSFKIALGGIPVESSCAKRPAEIKNKMTNEIKCFIVFMGDIFKTFSHYYRGKYGLFNINLKYFVVSLLFADPKQIKLIVFLSDDKLVHPSKRGIYDFYQLLGIQKMRKRTRREQSRRVGGLPGCG
jgi:hypothetical protein